MRDKIRKRIEELNRETSMHSSSKAAALRELTRINNWYDEIDPPVLTTEDGVKKYDGDPCFYLSKISMNVYDTTLSKSLYKKKLLTDFLFFDSKDKLNEYIDSLKKPDLSVAEEAVLLNINEFLDAFDEWKEQDMSRSNTESLKSFCVKKLKNILNNNS